MKYEVCNLGNFKVTIQRKNVMDSLFIMELNFFHNFGTCYSFKGYALKSKKFGKYEVCDGLYNSLLGAIMFFF